MAWSISPRRLAIAVASVVLATTTAYAQSFPIVGLGRQAGHTTPPQPRLNIYDLQINHPHKWNLYLLTMSQWQSSNQDDQDSYYQISGIHGVPNVAWNDVGPTENGNIGYCTHSSPLFPAWHRTYVALFEQVFIGKVHDVVESFSGTSDYGLYQNAAKGLRLPYW